VLDLGFRFSCTTASDRIYGDCYSTPGFPSICLVYRPFWFSILRPGFCMCDRSTRCEPLEPSRLVFCRCKFSLFSNVSIRFLVLVGLVFVLALQMSKSFSLLTTPYCKPGYSSKYASVEKLTST
jgi:hypothetical protein